MELKFFISISLNFFFLFNSNIYFLTKNQGRIKKSYQQIILLQYVLIIYNSIYMIYEELQNQNFKMYFLFFTQLQ